MFTINEFSVEKLKDPFDLLTGDRYEFRLYLSVDEEDELYTENGVYLRAIFKIEDEVKKITQYSFLDQSSDSILEFELEEDEEKFIIEFCEKNIPLPKEK